MGADELNKKIKKKSNAIKKCRSILISNSGIKPQKIGEKVKISSLIKEIFV
jgi:hypothetical protein